MFIVEMVRSRVRKKRILLGWLLLLIGILFGGLVLYRNFQEKKTVTYYYSENDESLVNPARGLYTQIYYKEPERLESIREEGQTLSLVTMSLKDHLEEPIPEEKLERLRILFEEARKYGVKVTNLHPDMTDTNLYREADFEQGEEVESYLLPEEIADAVRFVLQQREGVVVTDLTLRPQLHRIKRKPQKDIKMK